MNNLLYQFLNQFEELSEKDRQLLADQLKTEEYSKGEILLREGEVSKVCYMILSGCIRQYHLVDGVEKTTAFFTEGQAVVSHKSYSQQIPADHYFACVDDCLLLEGDPQSEQDFYARFPQLQELTRNMMQADLGETQQAFAEFIRSSPEERYLLLLEQRPELLHRVPQHQIASYLGVTPESLSRIKKRIAKR